MTKDAEFPAGSLAVVALPLGNNGDISERAARILALADIIAAEDTRTAMRFLKPLGVSARLVSYHDWNEAARSRWLIEKLGAGCRVALISEAGTPAISDPGFDLVREARRGGFTVLPVPGPSAVVAFLSVAGLPTDAFSFFGFPPARKSKRREFFSNLATRRETLVFYESPHRFEEALSDALEIFGDREAAFGREMTKLHEEFYYGTLSGMLDRVKTGGRIRGEVTWGISGSREDRESPKVEDVDAILINTLESGAPLKEASRELAKSLGLSSKEIYSRLSKLRSTP